jgi:transposase, IS30 family
MWPPSASLTLEDIEEIICGVANGLKNKDIAASIDQDESAVSREMNRHDGRDGYRAVRADKPHFSVP